LKLGSFQRSISEVLTQPLNASSNATPNHAAPRGRGPVRCWGRVEAEAFMALVS
jgi:hypothetical protein